MSIMTGPIAGRDSWVDSGHVPCCLSLGSLTLAGGNVTGSMIRKTLTGAPSPCPPSLLVQRAPPSLHRGLCGASSELAAPWLADMCPGERLRDSDPQHPDLKTGGIAPSSENAHEVYV